MRSDEMTDSNHRLSNLLKLLDCKNSAVRRQASRNLGTILENQTDDLGNLLWHILPYLSKSTWETRVASSESISLLFKTVMKLSSADGNRFISSSSIGADNIWSTEASALSSKRNTSLAEFDLSEVGKRCALRLAFIDRENAAHATEKSAQQTGSDQRKRIDQKLGLHPQLGLDSRNWYSDEDLLSRNFSSSELQSAGEESERLETARRARLETLKDPCSDTPKVLESFIQIVLSDSKSFIWETRHGAALALKQFVAVLGSKLTKSLVEIICHELLATLALDRLSDFVEAQAIAPVRETSAQCLALCLTDVADVDTVKIVCEKLKQFFAPETPWECKQSGLLVMKYLLPISNQEDCSKILASFKSEILSSLAEENDEIAAAAAQALLPVAKIVEKDWSIEALLKYTWSLLARWAESDEASISPILQLLLEWIVSDLTFIPNDWQLMLILKFLDYSTTKIREFAFEVLYVVTRRAGLAPVLPWPDVTVQLIFRGLYRRVLLEPGWDSSCPQQLNHRIAMVWGELLNSIGTEKIVTLICPFLGVWIACLMVSESNPNLNSFVSLDVESQDIHFGQLVTENGVGFNDFSDTEKLTNRDFIGGIEVMALDERKRQDIVTENKLLAAKILGITASVIGAIENVFHFQTGSESPSESLSLLLQLHLSSTSASHRSAVAMTLYEWAKCCSGAVRPSMETLDMLKSALLTPPFVYDETGLKMAEVGASCVEFLSELQTCGLHIQVPRSMAGIPPETGLGVCRTAYESALSVVNDRTKLEEKWAQLSSRISSITSDIHCIQGRLSCWLACAVLAWNCSLEKWNPLVKPLMDSVKSEANGSIADITATGLQMLIEQAATRKPSPNSKIVKNLISFHCSNSELTPCFDEFKDKKLEIVSIYRMQYSADKTFSGSVDLSELLMGRNAGKVIRALAQSFDSNLETIVPDLWSVLFNLGEQTCDQETVNRLQVMETVIPVISQELKEKLFQKHSDRLWEYLGDENPAVRHISGRVLANFARFLLPQVINAILPKGLKKVDKLENFQYRAGIVEFFFNLTELLGEKIVGIISLLSPAILGRMSDSEEKIRILASKVFGKLVSLMPLESDSNLLDFSDELQDLRNKNRHFLTLLTNPKGLKALKLPMELKDVTLRPYQLEGVTWLWFLNQYCLHGILCDDMGLGKTIQTLCVMGFSHQKKRTKYSSLIVCPRTLQNHWIGEIKRFFNQSDSLLNPISIENCKFIDWNDIRSRYSVIVTSYDIVRRFVTELGDKPWHYCVLDEGHIVRNAKTQMFKAITTLKADHRLILSGTPIQNSVLELWTLFEFLMPGYLGTQQSFNAKYVKPVQQSRDTKLVSDQVDSPGERALEDLHKQVLPFILRRQKTEVLHDLPPKIIQDYPCQLSKLQARLYDEFGAKIADQGIGRSDGGSEKRGLNPLMVLTYLRKLCDHPCLVLDEKNPSFSDIQKDAKSHGYGITDLELSGKMAALKELLRECDIGRTEESEDPSETQRSVLSQHRALIFCQFRATVDLIEGYLKNGELGSGGVNWLRLDGTVPTKDRQAMAEHFNSDLSVDLLLLTTQVGGLGLNLIGADVVIFVDHDWNPVKDLQAMDRAHRLGQRKTVNVYRLISEGTLEEKIMRVQKFKTHTAEVLIGDDNQSLLSMANDQLLDLLTLDKEANSAGVGELKSEPLKKKMRVTEHLEGPESKLELSELWNKSQYDEAFDMDEFFKLKN